ncbi:Glycoside hydrolase, family 1 [Penicillium digitatum]|uniref:Glycoside hydrolase, family 1 n=1 Tax=Penicillium digitatum TaxID=36651 RepID=A0A7T6XP85_PENDI|nr:Glycoside hydrolase, family 1 [Penicillium digitatum]
MMQLSNGLQIRALSTEFKIVLFLVLRDVHKTTPECMREQLRERLSDFTESNYALLREADIDFYGRSYHTSQFARHRDEPALETSFMGNVFISQKTDVHVLASLR